MILPNDRQLEMIVIGGMIQSEKYFWKMIENLIPDYFYTEIYRTCFEYMLKTKKNEFIAVSKFFENTEYRSEDLYDSSFSVSGDHEIETLQKLYIARESIISCNKAVNAFLRPLEFDPIETSSELFNSIHGLNSGQKETTVSIGSKIPGEFERIEKISDGIGAAFIKTYISDLDKKLSIMQHDYTIIGARPSNGKSALIAQICRNLTREGKSVLGFCIDSSVESEVSRNICAEANISLYNLNTGLMPKRDLPKLSAAASELFERKFYFDNSKKLTTDKIYAKCRRLISLIGPLDLVYIDFMQNVKYVNAKSIRERVSAISEELHDMTKEINCPIFGLSQLRRYENEEKQPPKISCLKESGDIEEDADNVLMLWYPWHYSKDNLDYKNILHVDVSKTKNGITGSLDLYFDAPTFNIRNIEKSYKQDWVDSYQ